MQASPISSTQWAQTVPHLSQEFPPKNRSVRSVSCLKKQRRLIQMDNKRSRCKFGGLLRKFKRELLVRTFKNQRTSRRSLNLTELTKADWTLVFLLWETIVRQTRSSNARNRWANSHVERFTHTGTQLRVQEVSYHPKGTLSPFAEVPTTLVVCSLRIGDLSQESPLGPEVDRGVKLNPSAMTWSMMQL